MGRSREIFWYAIRVLKEVRSVLEELRHENKETYYATQMKEVTYRGKTKIKEVPIFTSLVFVKCSEKYLREFKLRHNEHLFYYRDLVTGLPGKIDDHEMEVFQMVTKLKNQDDVRFFEEDKPEFHKGDRVRVTGGYFEGAEGYIKRVCGDRKLLVSITGVAAVIISNIRPQFLEKIEAE